jgi:gluconate 5-dehydrogenase
VDTGLDRHGQTDILVNIAGDAASVPAEDEPVDELLRLLQVNTTGVFALSQLVGRHMLTRGQGWFITIASLSATSSFDRHPLAGYVASKAAALGLTRELAVQWASRGVQVNFISPGWFPTPHHRHLRHSDQIAPGSTRAHRSPARPPHELDGPLLF